MRTLRILVVEDDRELSSLLLRGLGDEGFEVACASTGAEALASVGREPPAALVIDIGLPDADGRDLSHALRARGMLAPILFLTARDTLADKLSGFAAGGDDYIVKPFAMAELAARLRAMLSRAGAEEALVAGRLRLDPTGFQATIGSSSARLTPTEFRLLAALASRPGPTLARRALVRSAWPEGSVVHDNTLDVYIARLRRKLRALDRAPEITTVHGAGYRLS